MSDAPQAPNWFQASDGKWYPPPPPPKSTGGREVAKFLLMFVLVGGIVVLGLAYLMVDRPDADQKRACVQQQIRDAGTPGFVERDC
jgi:hypothetical protein